MWSSVRSLAGTFHLEAIVLGQARVSHKLRAWEPVRLSLKLLFEDKTGWGSGVLRSGVSWEKAVAENPAVELKYQGGFGGVPGGDGVQGTAEAEDEVITEEGQGLKGSPRGY